MSSHFLRSPLCPSVGPLHSDRLYDITASKEGFVLSPVEGTPGDFKAFALAGVTFKVHVTVVLTRDNSTLHFTNCRRLLYVALLSFHLVSS